MLTEIVLVHLTSRKLPLQILPLFPVNIGNRLVGFDLFAYQNFDAINVKSSLVGCSALWKVAAFVSSIFLTLRNNLLENLIENF